MVNRKNSIGAQTKIIPSANVGKTSERVKFPTPTPPPPGFKRKRRMLDGEGERELSRQNENEQRQRAGTSQVVLGTESFLVGHLEWEGPSLESS